MPGETPTQTRGRALALLLAAVVALPGAFSAVRGCDAVGRPTLERLVEQKAREVAALQRRLEALRRDVDRLADASEDRTERLHVELRETREGLSRALLDVALRRGGRRLRARLGRAEGPGEPLPALPRATRLPALKPPAANLEALESGGKR